MVAQPVLSGAATAQEEQAFYFTWGGYDIPELFVEYREKHGVNPDWAPYDSADGGLTKVRAGYVVDVMHPCNGNIPRWVEGGQLLPLDTAKLSHWDDVMPAMKKIGNVDGKHYSTPCEWGQTSITYRTDLVDFPDGEESWSVLWDERYRGKIGMIGNEGDSWWCAAIYAGVPFEEMHTEENIKKVEDLLHKQLPLVREYSDDMTTVWQALASGELVAAMTWNDAAVSLKADGVPVAFASPKEGALTWVCGAAIYVDAPRVDKAHDVANSLLSPETGRFMIEEFGYGHSSVKAFDLVSEEKLAAMGLSRDPEKILGSGKYQIPKSDEFAARIATTFSEIKAGF